MKCSILPMHWKKSLLIFVMLIAGHTGCGGSSSDATGTPTSTPTVRPVGSETPAPTTTQPATTTRQSTATATPLPTETATTQSTRTATIALTGTATPAPPTQTSDPSPTATTAGATATPTSTSVTMNCDVLPEGGFLSIWQNNPQLQATLGCPSSGHPRIEPAAWEIEASYQLFQHGAMIWISADGWYELADDLHSV